ncbi:MAG: alpha/beta hydrolase [Actinomycetia bacterium]|nr:alpha/beta hydrolase [Actinomycetes bacterium]
MSAGQRLPGAPEPMYQWDGDGVKIAGDSWGDPDGPLVILQHGGGQTRHAWRGAGETLGRAGYFAVALDARGHGDSEWATDGNYERDIMIQDLARVIEQIDKGIPILVGASMGGNTSLAAIGEDHVEARALVLVDIAPRIRSEGTKKIGQFMSQKPNGFDSLEEVAEAIANYQPHRKRPRNLDGLAKNIRLGDDGKYYWHWDPHFRRRPYVTKDEIRVRTRRLEGCASKLSIPTLLVRGGLSDVLDEEGAQAFLALVPQAEYVNVTDAAHMVAGDRNDAFGVAVIDFLTREVPVS